MRGKGAVVWFTGVPASGKSTIARLVRDELNLRGISALFLDGDDLRKVMTPNPACSDDEREAFYATLGYVAALGEEAGSVSLVAATAGERAYRDQARSRAGEFVEVFLRCDRAVLERRDPKGRDRCCGRPLPRAERAGSRLETGRTLRHARTPGTAIAVRLVMRVLIVGPIQGWVRTNQPNLDVQQIAEPKRAKEALTTLHPELMIVDQAVPDQERDDLRQLAESLGCSVIAAASPRRIPGTTLQEIEKYAILETLKAVGGSTTKAAKVLGISVRKIQYRLKDWKVTPREIVAREATPAIAH